MTIVPSVHPVAAMPRATGDAGQRRFLWLIILVVFVAQIALYRHSFFLLPVSDHFGAPLSEISRGQAQGPLVFFTQSPQPDKYRPLQSLTMWLFGSISSAHVYFWVRVMNFVGMAFYAVALGLWLRYLPISLAAAVVAAIVFFVHPAEPLPLAGLDGLAGMYCSAAMWIGAWFVFRYWHRPLLSVSIALLCFIIATGYKEYGFGMVGLAPLTAIVFGGRRAWGTAIALFLVLVAAFLGVLLIRHLVLPPDMSRGFGYVRTQPAHLLTNLAIMTTGLLFAGNSVWVYVHQSPPVFALVALSMIAVAVVVCAGIVEKIRADKPGESGREGQASTLMWVIFLLLSMGPASFPANVIYHFSEMYLLPMILPLALLCGLAADGLLRRRGWRLWGGLAVALGCLVGSMDAVQAKINGLHQGGLNAQHMLQELSATLPANVRGERLALLFRNRDLPPRRTYSVFRVGDDDLLGDEPFAMEFVRPGQGLLYDQVDVNDFSDPISPRYDMVLGWDAVNRKWIPLAGVGPGASTSHLHS